MEKTNKISNFFKSQSKQTKSLLTIGLGAHIIYTFYSVKDYGYILSQYGFPPYIGRVLGTFLGVFGPVLIISMIISIFPYFIFRSVAEKYKKYLDYVAIIFIVLSAIMIFSGYNTQKNLQNFKVTEKIDVENNLVAFGFTKYNFSEDNLDIYFPQAPKKQEVEVNIEEFKKNRYYTALSQNESVRYLVMAAILDQKILSQESRDAWLKNLLESKIANHKSPEIKDDQYVQFKGMKSRLYSFTSKNESGDIIRYKTIAFIYNGKPFELEIIYPADYGGNLYWNEFIESIELK